MEGMETCTEAEDVVAKVATTMHNNNYKQRSNSKFQDLHLCHPHLDNHNVTYTLSPQLQYILPTPNRYKHYLYRITSSCANPTRPIHTSIGTTTIT
eukprot:9913627-Ditylum_brightwellii.AAC.1